MTEQIERIFCFQHCDNRKNIFSFEPSSKCQICDESPKTYIVAPHCLPSPFSNPKENPCCIVMRPSHGDFLNNYQNSIGLHLGLTDLNGKVHEFDTTGLSCDLNPELWNNCLIVDLVTTLIKDLGDDSDSSMKNKLGLTRDIISYNWHMCLSSPSLLKNWTASCYDSENNNCYNFVLSFLKLLDFTQFCRSLDDKTDFCQNFLVPKTRLAARYIGLYRKMKKNHGVFICDTS